MNPYRQLKQREAPTKDDNATENEDLTKSFAVAAFTAMLFIGASWYAIAVTLEHKRQRMLTTITDCRFTDHEQETEKDRQEQLLYLESMLKEVQRGAPNP